MKSINIYKTNSKFKIVTQSRTEDGFFLSVLPAFVLDLSCSLLELEEAVFEALSNSKNGIRTTDRIEYPRLEKQIMNEIKERSYTSLYKKSSSCNLRFNENILKIYPEDYFTKGNPNDGLSWVEEEMVKVHDPLNNRSVVIDSIIDLLNRKFR